MAVSTRCHNPDGLYWVKCRIRGSEFSRLLTYPSAEGNSNACLHVLSQLH
jgi:hypothetical protein